MAFRNMSIFSWGDAPRIMTFRARDKKKPKTNINVCRHASKHQKQGVVEETERLKYREPEAGLWKILPS